jgi:hypothetical protein
MGAVEVLGDSASHVGRKLLLIELWSRSSSVSAVDTVSVQFSKWEAMGSP